MGNTSACVVAYLPAFGYTVLMARLVFRICLLLLCCSLVACGGVSVDTILRIDPGPDQTGPSPLVANDPAGPIPEPELPPDLAQAARDRLHPGVPAGDAPVGQDATAFAPGSETRPQDAPRITYTLEVLSPEAPELIQAFTDACLLERLKDTPLSTRTGLDRRLRSDLETAEEVLQAHGYFEGTASGKIRREGRDGNDTPDAGGTSGRNRPPDGTRASGRENAPDAYMVTVTFTPGRQYTVGKSTIALSDPSKIPPDDTQGRRWRKLPQTLADVGLKPGSPALSGAVLDAVAAVREEFRNRGFPFARTVSARHFLNRETRELETEMVIDSGPLVFMGDLAVKGESPVKKRFLEGLMTWKPGWVWNQNLVDNFRDALRQSGLFSAAEIAPAPENDDAGLRPVVVELTPAQERTVGGALKYNSDFGFGVQGYWMHRNITGRGDRLRFEAPVWQDLQEFVATYRLPFFISNSQDFVARAAIRNENTDAYELTSATGSMGVERRISRRWRGALSVMGEGGVLKDPDEPRRDYWMTGLPGMLHYNGANSLLDAIRGFRATLAAAPYTGEFNGDFTAVRASAEAQVFVPVIGDETLVMAFRGMYGLLSGVGAQDVPASIRWYVGGGGSVRGYEHQSLGPRNDSRDPLGGASAVEFSGEARMRFTETWGLVAFVDGGMAYEDATPDKDETLRWGAGLGLRFFTAIGPVRLDVATPLNPRSKDSSFQIYFSIGQSF